MTWTQFESPTGYTVFTPAGAGPQANGSTAWAGTLPLGWEALLTGGLAGPATTTPSHMLTVISSSHPAAGNWNPFARLTRNGSTVLERQLAVDGVGTWNDSFAGTAGGTYALDIGNVTPGAAITVVASVSVSLSP